MQTAWASPLPSVSLTGTGALNPQFLQPKPSIDHAATIIPVNIVKPDDVVGRRNRPFSGRGKHTSHVTRHTSHVTRHTSHVTVAPTTGSLQPSDGQPRRTTTAQGRRALSQLPPHPARWRSARPKGGTRFTQENRMGHRVHASPTEVFVLSILTPYPLPKSLRVKESPFLLVPSPAPANVLVLPLPKPSFLNWRPTTF